MPKMRRGGRAPEMALRLMAGEDRGVALLPQGRDPGRGLGKLRLEGLQLLAGKLATGRQLRRLRIDLLVVGEDFVMQMRSG